MVYKTYIFINSIFFPYETLNQYEKSLTQLSYYFFEERYYFCQKVLFFAKYISKIKETFVLKGIFSETKYLFVLNYQILSF